MRFEEACGGWQDRRLSQEKAARDAGGCVSARPAPAKLVPAEAGSGGRFDPEWVPGRQERIAGHAGARPVRGGRRGTGRGRYGPSARRTYNGPDRAEPVSGRPGPGEEAKPCGRKPRARRGIPSKGCPTTPTPGATSPMTGPGRKWREAKAALARRGTDRYALEQWLREQRRAFAIENGQIEQLYTLRQGVTEQLIVEGLECVRVCPHGRRRAGGRDPARAADGPGGRAGADLRAGERGEAARTCQPEGAAPPADPAPGGRGGDRRARQEGAGRSAARGVQAPAQQPAPRGRAHPRVLSARARAFGDGPGCSSCTRGSRRSRYRRRCGRHGCTTATCRSIPSRTGTGAPAGC